MLKKYLLISIVIMCSFIIVGCSGKTSTSSIKSNEKLNVSTQPTLIPNESDSKSFKVIYSGFIIVDENKINDYAMPNDYIITNKDDWKTWNAKYTNEYPYYLEDMGMNWDNDCLVVRAYYGAKDFWNTIKIIKDINFDNNTVNITFDEDGNQVYAFNKNKEKHIAFYVIKVKKPSDLSSIDSRFLTYTNYTQENNK